MAIGVVYAIVAYSIYSFGDAIVKAFGPTLSVFEIGFFVSLFGLIPALLSKPKGEQWRDSFKLTHPLLVHLRSITGVISSTLVFYAFVTIPFAEAYALAFLMPLCITIMSVLVLRERVSGLRWALMALGLFGVMLVVRPGFKVLELGHLAALGCACFGAATTTILRIVAPKERRVSLILLPAIYMMAFNAIMMIPSFVVPSLQQIALLMLAGSLIGIGHILLILATRVAPASHVAPTQYIQIIWAIALGAFFFGEFPDLIAYLGMAVVMIAGVMNVFMDGKRVRVAGRFAAYRARRNNSPTNLAETQNPEL
jgi:drug/metabolite transporter (DMT)-like permease